VIFKNKILLFLSALLPWENHYNWIAFKGKIWAVVCWTGGWCWPAKKDTLLYYRSDVIKKLCHPLPVNARGLFKKFEDLSHKHNN